MSTDDLLRSLPEEGSPEFAALMAAGKARMEEEEKAASDLVDRLDAKLNDPLTAHEQAHLANCVETDSDIAEIVRKITSTLEEM